MASTKREASAGGAQKKLTEQERKAAWLEGRRLRITGTDLPAIMGVPGAYGTPESVWLSKVEPVQVTEESEAMRLGLLVQPITLNIYAEVMGQPLVHQDPYALVRDEKSILAASLDARWRDKPEPPVDAKNVGVRSSEWGDEGSAVVPRRILLQMMVQIAVTGAPFADVAANFANRHVGHFRVPADDEMLAGIREFADSWWKRHVVGMEPPPITGSEEWSRWFAAQAPRVEAYLESDSLLDQEVDLFRLYRAAREDAERMEALHANRIKAAIVAAGASGLKGLWGRINFKPTKDRESTDWKALAEAFAQAYNIDINVAKQGFTSSKPGTRSFRPAFADNPDQEK